MPSGNVTRALRIRGENCKNNMPPFPRLTLSSGDISRSQGLARRIVGIVGRYSL